MTINKKRPFIVIINKVKPITLLPMLSTLYQNPILPVILTCLNLIVTSMEQESA
jgi:hypothetical protein